MNRQTRWVTNSAGQNGLCANLGIDLSVTENSVSSFLVRQESSCSLLSIHTFMYVYMVYGMYVCTSVRACSSLYIPKYMYSITCVNTWYIKIFVIRCIRAPTSA